MDSLHTREGTKGGYNWSFYSNPEVDGLLEKAAVTADEAARNEQLAQIQELAVDDAIAIWLDQSEALQLYSDKMKNVTFDLIGHTPVLRFQQVTVEP